MNAIRNVVALAMLFSGCASNDVPKRSTLEIASLPQKIVQKAFLTEPISISTEGAPSEYGPEGEKALWLNVLRGGSSKSSYRQFMLRVPSKAGAGMADVVFFNDDSKGFYVPVVLTSDASSPGVTFELKRRFGGGEAYTYNTTLRFSISPANAQASSLDGTVECDNRLSVGFIPAGHKRWRSRMRFVEAEVSGAVLSAAKDIDITIRR